MLYRANGTIVGRPIDRRPQRVGDYIGLHCGDEVCDKSDPRHTGTVEAIFATGTVRVKFANGFFSEVRLADLKAVRTC